MTAPRQSSPANSNGSQDGGFWHPSLGYLFIAFGLALGGMAYLLLSPSSPLEMLGEGDKSAATTPTASATTTASNTAGTWPPALPARAQATDSIQPEGDADPTRDLSSYVMRGEKPTMPEVIERLHKAGVHEGLGAFNPPGTRPPLIGLAVPEDFVLPEGYVRHHQATDDGQRIEAILMFAPDRQFFDANKQPITVPANRVVPPEHAPPGLPIRRIVLPKPIEPESR
ncbi:MAG: hypothetical protein HYZ45_04685 [Burkholderiales bacterium]|nr:hypothetical protein [Burkholderiales bacterium]